MIEWIKIIKKGMVERMKNKKIAVVMVVLAAFLCLAGCGKKIDVANWKEYTSPDGTFSVKADEGYEIVDMQMDNWLALEAPDGRDSILAMQFAKSGGLVGGFGSLGEAIAFVEESNQLSDKTEVEKPESTVLANIEAYTYKMTQDGYTEEFRVVYGETDFAHYMLMYSEAKLKRHGKGYFNEVCAAFKENADVIEEKQSASAQISDTLRWFNASNSILIAVNGWDYNLYGGMEADQASQMAAAQVLDNSWGVTDKAAADETLDWLLSEGHRVEFAGEMEYLAECGMNEVSEEEREAFFLENFEVTAEQAEIYAGWYGAYTERQEDAASGWDYNRALSQIANFYLAGYYTLEEALDASMDVAEIIQSSFDSWDDYMESYFIGYEYWADESSAERRELYEQIKSAGDSPFSVDFNTTLEKDW